MRFEVLHDYPEVLVNLKTISGLGLYQGGEGHSQDRALTRLEDIAFNPIVRARYTALARQPQDGFSPCPGDGHHRR